jgi:REP element-mobilizing transposase RayT
VRCAKLWQQFHGRLPFEVYWEATAEEREGFRQMAAGHHDRRSLNGPFHLHHDDTCRQILIDAFAFREGEHYETLAYSIMPNHVHWVVRHLSARWTMGQLVANLKRHVARQSNLHLGLTGKPYWQPESWDRFIRTQKELERSVRYTLLNPVNCHLIDDWCKWPGNYAHTNCKAWLEVCA